VRNDARDAHINAHHARDDDQDDRELRVPRGGGRPHPPRGETSLPEEWHDGTVVRMVIEKGFCFVRDGRGVEAFLHMSCCEGDTWSKLTAGTPVSFLVTSTAKGPRAVLCKLRGA
jgi:cold shock CspA family protein